MDVTRRNFLKAATVLLVARSEYYAEWRREVDQIFRAVNGASIGNTAPPEKSARLILIILPECLSLASVHHRILNVR